MMRRMSGGLRLPSATFQQYADVCSLYIQVGWGVAGLVAPSGSAHGQGPPVLVLRVLGSGISDEISDG